MRTSSQVLYFACLAGVLLFFILLLPIQWLYDKYVKHSKDQSEKGEYREWLGEHSRRDRDKDKDEPIVNMDIYP